MVSPIDPARPARGRRLLVAGWLLALPGLWVIAGMLLWQPVSDWAGCAAPSGLSFPPCPAGLAGGVADAMRWTVASSAVASFVGLGAVPPLYTLVFVASRAARRLGLWFVRRGGQDASEPGRRGWAAGFALLLGLMVIAAALARPAGEIVAGQVSEATVNGLIGLAAVGLAAAAVWAVRRRRARG